MLGIQTLRTVFRQYGKDKNGAFAIVWAVSAAMVIIAAGAAYDYSQVSSAQGRSQEVADSVALRAAIYASNNDGPPATSSDGLMHSQVYRAKELGYDYDEDVKGGENNVRIKVIYDAAKKEARSVVWGKTRPAFMQMIGYKKLNFKARSTVKYIDVDLKDPASIFLVMDNSGSMAWDDKKVNPNWTDQPGAQARISGLKTSVHGFMGTLDNLVGPQNTPGSRVLRTGMLAYNSNTINGRTVLPRWGTLTANNINNMSASGGTNSAPSMSTVATWMGTEPTVHNNEHGKTPLKFVIFMTDGVNTSGSTQWVPDNTTNYWRKRRCNWYSCWYNYKTQSWSPGNGWQEGRWQNMSDSSTIASCNALKAAGVKVYTIGYGLEPGYYYENYTWRGQRQYEYISQATTNQAYALLQGCASEPDNFIAAENAADLADAFQTIGEEIAIEIIRIAS